MALSLPAICSGDQPTRRPPNTCRQAMEDMSGPSLRRAAPATARAWRQARWPRTARYQSAAMPPDLEISRETVDGLTFKALAIERIEVPWARSDSIVRRLSCVRWEKFLGISATIFEGEYVLHFEIAPVPAPNVRAKRATTAGRQARAGENVPRTARPGLVACRWRSG